ncbi:hypothetical protein LTR53_001851 [Teratosphaeriaceae sp. CCFEE 6253]|nr:hypothetical protein LTR53_001851 [Teratosphaeriaceae sp. CCFEE 6253]
MERDRLPKYRNPAIERRITRTAQAHGVQVSHDSHVREPLGAASQPYQRGPKTPGGAETANAFPFFDQLELPQATSTEPSYHPAGAHNASTAPYACNHPMQNSLHQPRYNSPQLPVSAAYHDFDFGMSLHHQADNPSNLNFVQPPTYSPRLRPAAASYFQLDPRISSHCEVPATMQDGLLNYPMRGLNLAGPPLANSHVPSKTMRENAAGEDAPPPPKKRKGGFNTDHVPIFGRDIAPQDTDRLYPGAMSAMELVCLYPNHTLWPDVALRLLGGGWEPKLIAAAQLFFHGKLNPVDQSTQWGRLRQQIPKAGKIKFANKDWTPSAFPNDVTPVTSYAAASYVPRPNVRRPTTMKLIDMAKGILHCPATEDQSFLSGAIHLAVQLKNTTWTIDDVAGIAQARHWVLPADSLRTDWDGRSRDRMIAMLEGLW